MRNRFVKPDLTSALKREDDNVVYIYIYMSMWPRYLSVSINFMVRNTPECTEHTMYTSWGVVSLDDVAFATI